MTRIRLLFLLNGVTFAVFGPFVSVVLEGRGFDPAEIGLISALTSIAYLVALSAWGHLADVVLGRARALRLAILAAAVMLLAFQLRLPAGLLAAAYVGYAACLAAVGPLSDALAVNALLDPGREYGRVRGLSSASFAVAAVVLGLAYGALGYGAAGGLFLGMAVLVATVTIGVPDLGRAELSASRRGGAVREVLAIQPALPRVLLAVGLAHVGVFAAFTFLPLRLVELGGGPPEVALSAAAAAAAEVAGMVATSRLARRFGLRTTFLASALLYVVCLGLWSVLASPAAIIASRVLSGVGYAGLWVSSVMTIQRLLPPRLQGSGQALLSMTTVGLGGFSANVVGGLLYSSQGPAALFGVSAVLAIAGGAVAWTTLPRTEPRRPLATRTADAHREPEVDAVAAAPAPDRTA